MAANAIVDATIRFLAKINNYYFSEIMVTIKNEIFLRILPNKFRGDLFIVKANANLQTLGSVFTNRVLTARGDPQLGELSSLLGVPTGVLEVVGAAFGRSH
jgi:hypothetical protein